MTATARFGPPSLGQSALDLIEVCHSRWHHEVCGRGITHQELKILLDHMLLHGRYVHQGQEFLQLALLEGNCYRLLVNPPPQDSFGAGLVTLSCQDFLYSR